MFELLFVCLFILFLLSFYISGGDIFSPPVLVTLGFLVSVIFASFFKYGSWWSGNISSDTVTIYLIGVVSFLIGYYIVCRKVNYKKNQIVLAYIHVNNIYLYLFIFLAILSTLLNLYYIIKIVGTSGGWTSIMMRYRIATLYAEANATESIRLPGFLGTAKMLVQAGGYVFVYILANNRIANPAKKNTLLFLTVIISLLSTATTAQRLDLIRMPVAYMAIQYLLKRKSGKLSKKVNGKLCFQYCIIIFIVIEMFANLKGIFGRSSSTETPIEYLARYIGGPILLFNDFLNNPTYHNSLFGKETFWGIYDFLNKITGNDIYKYTYGLEFRNIEGKKIGNVYSAFRMYYSDFGTIGVLILSSLLGIIFGLLYKRIIKEGHKSYPYRIKIGRFAVRSNIISSLLIYSVIIHACLLLFYQDWFYAYILTWYQIKMFIFMFLFKWVIVDKGVKL